MEKLMGSSDAHGGHGAWGAGSCMAQREFLGRDLRCPREREGAESFEGRES